MFFDRLTLEPAPFTFLPFTLSMIGYEHGCAGQPATPEILEGRIRLFQREKLGGDPDWYLWGEGQKLFRVLTGEVGDRGNTFLTPQDVVGKRRNIAHVYPPAYDSSPWTYSTQRGGYQRPCRGKDYCCVEFFGRERIRIPRPCGAHLYGKLLRR